MNDGFQNRPASALHHDSVGTIDSSRSEYREEEISYDPSDAQVFGRTFIQFLYKILKIGSIYEVTHNQTRLTAQEFMDFFQRAMVNYTDEGISVLVRDELGVVNGQPLRLKRKAQQRLNELRDIFAVASIKGLLLKRNLSIDEFLHFLDELRKASKTHAGMEHVRLSTIDIQHGPPTRNIIEAVMNVNKAMYVAHVYIRGLVKLKNLHEHVRRSQDADVATGVVKRIMASISELIGDEDFTILGLLPLRLVAPDLSTHSMNAAIYAMIIADRLGLSAQKTSAIGMSIIYQDVDRLVGIPVGHRDRDEVIETQAQYGQNLRDVARMLPRVKGDVISTLRVLNAYERGCPYDQSVKAPFYRRNRKLHLAPRIIDMCRSYDLLIQGLEGYKSRRPDLAIEYLQSRKGTTFDAALVDLMVSTLGVFPIGTTVQLTSGEKAVIIKTPNASGDPRRPVVRILNVSKPSTIDLAEPRYQHIEIVGSVEVDPAEISVSKVFLLS
ncbi:MAG: hypothetical protein R3E66_22030 [bacterium]